MSHDHSHHQHHVITGQQINRAFVIGIILNFTFVLIELGAGFYSNSLALISDAGHNLSDVATLGLSLFAFHLTKKKATTNFTFGFSKSTILVSLANSVILLVAVGSIGWEAIHRFLHPQTTTGSLISIVAGIGILINVASALLFFRDKNTDLNVKGAYLHLMVDALVSVGVVIAGFIISYTHWQWIDPLISIGIMAIVLWSTWGILKESLKLSLDAVPTNINLEKIKLKVLENPSINDIHHVHIWAMSTTKNAMTAHLVINQEMEEREIAALKNNLKHELTHLNIHHVTLETEKEDCSQNECE